MTTLTGLRVGLVHSFYSSKQSSGENHVVMSQIQALEAAGATVELVSSSTDELESDRSYRLRAGIRVATSRGNSPATRLESFRPDVVHVHNLFPNFGRTWARKWSGPIVCTMHNYRPMCAAGTLFRDGQMCTDCLDRGSAAPAVLHGCYRNSRVATLPVAVGQRFERDPILASARRIVVLTETMQDLYAAMGIPQQRMCVLPNFIESSGEAPHNRGHEWLFVGRLASEKGIEDLVRQWPDDHVLRIVGSGPLEREIRGVAPRNVKLMGRLPSRQVNELMGRAFGVVIPSRWPEGLPNVYLEAIAAGTPVVAWHPSSVARLVESEGTGLVAEGDLTAVLAQAANVFPSLRHHCREVFTRNYTKRRWTERIDHLYREVLGETDPCALESPK